MKTTFLAVALFATIASAQEKIEMPAASPAASASRVVGTCKISIAYSSPGVKGRKMFGGMIPYDKVWRTGANQPSTIEFSEPVKFADKDVPAGKYMLATIPGNDSWTVILNKNANQWGVYAYQESEDLLRVTAKPSAIDLSECLDIRLTPKTRTSVDLEILFERTKVAVPISVDVDGMTDKKIEEMLARKPNDSATLFPIADYYLQSGRHLDKAHEYFQRVAEDRNNPFRAIAIWRRGQVEWKLNKKDAAIKSFDEAAAAARESKQMAGVVGEIEAMKAAFLTEKK
jgi:hypothetical protein